MQFRHLKRREVITLLGGVAAARSLIQSLSLFPVGDPRSLCLINPQETDIKPFAVSTAPHRSRCATL
jgi:hypothetical protein